MITIQDFLENFVEYMDCLVICLIKLSMGNQEAKEPDFLITHVTILETSLRSHWQSKAQISS